MGLKETGVRLVADNASGFISDLGRADKAVEGFGVSSEGASVKTIALGTAIGNLAAAGIGKVVDLMGQAGRAAVGFLGQSITLAADLEAQMDAVGAVMGATNEEIAMLNDLVIDLGIDPNLKVSSLEAAEAIEMLARNGVSLEEIMNGAARGTVFLANATGAEFALAADVATDAMALFNIEADDMIRVVDGVTGVTNNSKFTVDDYALALRNGAANASQMGVSLEDFNVVIAASAEEMGSGMRAGTGFNNFITRLTPNTKTATEAMRELNLITADGQNVFFDATGTLKGMDEVAAILNETLYGTSEVVSEVGGRTAEQNELLESATDVYNKAKKSINDYQLGLKGATLTEEARQKKLEELNAQMINAQNIMDELGGIRGDLVTTTKQLTDAERSAYIETIFGNDAQGVAIALAAEGAVVYTDLAKAAEELGISQDVLNQYIDDGITGFEILEAKMSLIDSEAAAATRVANLRGALDILGGVVEAVQLKIGGALSPAITIFAQTASKFLDENSGPLIAFFDNLGKVLTNFATGFSAAFGEGDSLFGSILSGLVSAGFEDAAASIDSFVNGVVRLIEWVSGAGMMVNSFFQTLYTIFAERDWGALGQLVVGGIMLAFQAFNEYVVPILQGWYDAFVAWVHSVDWLAVGQGILNGVMKAWEMFNEYAVPVLLGWYNALATWAQGIDWGAIGRTILTGVMKAWELFNEYAVPVLLTWYEALRAWFEMQDWAAIGRVVETGITQALGTLWEFSQPHLQTWYDNAFNWATTQADWNAIGNRVAELLVTGLDFVTGGLLTRLTILYNDFVTWANNADWEAISQIATERIIEGIGKVWAGSQLALLGGMFNLFSTDWRNLDWEAEGQEAVNFIVDGLKNIYNAIATWVTDTFQTTEGEWEALSWSDLGTYLVDQITAGTGKILLEIPGIVGGWGMLFKGEVLGIDWASMGGDIVQGIINGLTAKAGDLAAAAAQMAQNAWQAAKDKLGISSPSKAFHEIGEWSIDGFIEGIGDKGTKAAQAMWQVGTNVVQSFTESLTASQPLLQETIDGLFDFAGKLGSVGNAAAAMYRKEVVDPIADELSELVKFEQQYRKQAEERLGLEGLDDPERLARIALFGNEQQRRDALALLDLQGQIAAKKDEQVAAEEKLLKLQEEQQRLGFLKSQLDLLNFIRENGLDPSVLGGLQLGANADPLAIVEATSAAMEAVIGRVSGALNPAASGTQLSATNSTTTNTANNVININGADHSPQDLANAIAYALANI